MQLFGETTLLSDDFQELDLAVDRKMPNVYKGFRGAFVSIWQGVTE